MKTIKDFKGLLNFEHKGIEGLEGNTMLGMQLNKLFGKHHTECDASIHDLEDKIEVIAQMHKNGIDVFKDEYKIGSVSKAYYQYMLSKYKQYK